MHDLQVDIWYLLEDLCFLPHAALACAAVTGVHSRPTLAPVACKSAVAACL